jgi:hypothetical protein
MTTIERQLKALILAGKPILGAGVCLSILVVLTPCPIQAADGPAIREKPPSSQEQFFNKSLGLSGGGLEQAGVVPSTNPFSFSSFKLAMAATLRPTVGAEDKSEPPARPSPSVQSGELTNSVPSAQIFNSSWIEAMRRARSPESEASQARGPAAPTAELNSSYEQTASTRLVLPERGSTGFDLRLSRLWTVFADGEPFFSFDQPEEKLDRTRLTCERKDYLEVHGMIGRLGFQCRF